MFLRRLQYWKMQTKKCSFCSKLHNQMVHFKILIIIIQIEELISDTFTGANIPILNIAVQHIIISPCGLLLVDSCESEINIEIPFRNTCVLASHTSTFFWKDKWNNFVHAYCFLICFTRKSRELYLKLKIRF